MGRPEVDRPPKGISRHEVRFIAIGPFIYAIKELPTRPARRDYDVLRRLELADAPAVRAVGLVEGRHPDPTMEQAAALITRYEDFSYSYHELLQGPGFGIRRNQMLDAFAGLFAELHVAGCFWGDGSLSNVLYRFDADKVETMLVDAETAEIHPELSDGQREQDLGIMIENVAWGMADIAAQQGVDVEEADMALGEGIAERYRGLWHELTEVWTIGPDERYKINERVRAAQRARIHRRGGRSRPHRGWQPAPGEGTGGRPGLPRRQAARAHRGRRPRVPGEADPVGPLLLPVGINGRRDPDGEGDRSGSVAGQPIRADADKAAGHRRRGRSGPGLLRRPLPPLCHIKGPWATMSGPMLAFDDWVAEGRPGYPLV